MSRDLVLSEQAAVGFSGARVSDRTILAISIVGAITAVVGGIVYYRRRRAASRFGASDALGQVVGKTEAAGMTLTHHRDPKMPIQKRVKIIQDMVWQGVQDPEMRKLALEVTHHCPERDGECEARAIYDAIKANVRYTGDVAPVKLGADGPVEGIDLFQSAKRTWEFKGGDCLPVGTLLLNEGHKFTPIEKLVIGSRIWGRDDWTTVKDVWFKGVLPVDRVCLSNGKTFLATSNHKIYLADISTFESRIHVRDLCVGDVLLNPSRSDGRPVVVRLERNVTELPVYDLSTEDHYVYLPEADVTVSNCDDHSILGSVLLALNGITPKLRITASSKDRDFSHIYLLAGVPKMRPTKWVAIDTTLPGKRFGVEVPYGKHVDFPA